MAIRPATLVSIRLPGQERPSELIATEVEPAQVGMMGYVIVDGRDLQPGDGAAAVLAVSVARYFGLHVGDQLPVATPAGVVALTLVGLHADPMWCPYPSCDIQNLYIRPGALGPGGTGTQAVLGVRLAKPTEAQQVVNHAQREAGDGRIVTAWTWLHMRRGVQLTQGISTLSLMLFAIGAIFASALITANIIGGAVLRQSREIAVMKVLGMTRVQVWGLFVGQNIALSLAGAGAGLTLGYGISRQMLRPLAETMGNPGLLQFQSASAGVTVVAILVSSGATAALAAWRNVILRPAMVLQEGGAAPSTRVGWTVRVLTSLRAPAPILLGVKDALARPGRAFLTVVSVVLYVITLTLSTALGGLAEQTQTDPSALGVPYDLWANTRSAPPGSVREALAGRPDVAVYADQAYVLAATDEPRVTFSLRALGGEWRRLAFQVIHGRLPSAPGELALAPGALEAIGVGIGETVRVQVGGHEAVWTVVGEYRDPFNLGMMALTTLETLRTAWPEAPVESVLVGLRKGADARAVAESLRTATADRAMVTLTRTVLLPPTVLDALGRTRSLSLLMAVIAMLSLLNSTLMTAREQMREVGLRKAVGMTPGQVVLTVAVGGGWLGLLGSGLGVPAGVILTRSMLAAMSDTSGFARLQADLSLPALSLLLVGGVTLAAASAIPAALWAGRLPTARVLAAE